VKKIYLLLSVLCLVVFFAVLFPPTLMKVQHAKYEPETVISLPDDGRLPVFTINQNYLFTAKEVEDRVFEVVAKQTRTLREAEKTRKVCEATNSLLSQTLNELREKDAKIAEQAKKSEDAVNARTMAVKYIGLVNIAAALFTVMFKGLAAFSVAEFRKKVFDSVALGVPFLQAIIVWIIS